MTDTVWCGPINGSRAPSVSMPTRSTRPVGAQSTTVVTTSQAFPQKRFPITTCWSVDSPAKTTVSQPPCATARGFAAEKASCGGRLNAYSGRRGTRHPATSFWKMLTVCYRVLQRSEDVTSPSCWLPCRTWAMLWSGGWSMQRIMGCPRSASGCSFWATKRVHLSTMPFRTCKVKDMWVEEGLFAQAFPIGSYTRGVFL